MDNLTEGKKNIEDIYSSSYLESLPYKASILLKDYINLYNLNLCYMNDIIKNNQDAENIKRSIWESCRGRDLIKIKFRIDFDTNLLTDDIKPKFESYLRLKNLNMSYKMEMKQNKEASDVIKKNLRIKFNIFIPKGYKVKHESV